MQRRRPAERARPRAADALIQRKRIGIGTHLRSSFGKWNVADVRAHPDVSRNRIDDVGDALVGLVVGVKYAERLGMRRNSEIDVGKVTHVHAGPVVIPFTDDADQPV